jgi:serine protease Do
MDASITPGCSGGALLDLDGKVIGMTTALAGIASDRPGGFAIPFDANTRRIIDVLKRGEEVEYGFLGVVLDPDRGAGARLQRISPGSPAHLAGLQAGDHVVSINGVRVQDTNDLFLYIGIALAGNTIRIEVSRGPGGFVRSYTVKLAKFYVGGPVIAARRPAARFGLRVDYTSILTQRNPFPRWSRTITDGVVIREVIPGSPADQARLQPDKVITHVDGKAVHNPAEYYERVARAAGSVELTFLNSEGQAERLTLKE